MTAINRCLFGFACVLLLSAAVYPHEYWLEPDTFFPAVRERVNLRLFLGEGLKKEEERPFQKDKTTSFRHFFALRGWDRESSDGAMPFYSFEPAADGNHLFTSERNWSFVKLESAKFDEYLREDGMEYIIAERAKLGESQKEGRERYSRFIKTLLQVGEKRDDIHKTDTRLRLDITPLENPYTKKVGDTLRFKIHFDGKPLAGKTAFADNRDGDLISKQKLLTDSAGRATVKLDRKGVWLVRIVFMQRCKKECGEAEWESFWGAFSFGVR